MSYPFNDSKWIDLCILRNIALTHFLSLFFLPVSLSVLLSLFFPSLFLWLPRESEWVCIWGDSCYRDEEVFLVFCCHGNFGHLISPTHEVEAPHLTILHVLVHTHFFECSHNTSMYYAALYRQHTHTVLSNLRRGVDLKAYVWIDTIQWHLTWACSLCHALQNVRIVLQVNYCKNVLKYDDAFGLWKSVGGVGYEQNF